eukprot:6483893-Heterocapsa_arctica.AAC.1
MLLKSHELGVGLSFTRCVNAETRNKRLAERFNADIKRLGPMAVGFYVKALGIAVSTVPATIYGCEQQYFSGRDMTNSHRSIACALGPSGQHRNPGLVVALGCPPAVNPEQGIALRRIK